MNDNVVVVMLHTFYINFLFSPSDSCHILFCFSFLSLIKNPRDRPGPGRMLEHPFIRKWEDVPMDLAGWVKEVWNWK